MSARAAARAASRGAVDRRDLGPYYAIRRDVEPAVDGRHEDGGDRRDGGRHEQADGHRDNGTPQPKRTGSSRGSAQQACTRLLPAPPVQRTQDCCSLLRFREVAAYERPHKLARTSRPADKKTLRPRRPHTIQDGPWDSSMSILPLRSANTLPHLTQGPRASPAPQSRRFQFLLRPHDAYRPRLRSLTPAPPPFSSMNSTPALSIAILILAPVSVRPRSGPSCASSRFIVGTETPASDANCSCDHASSARAALTWRIDTFSIDFVMLKIYTFRINIRQVQFRA